VTADWLYPLSSNAEYWFVLPNGRTLDTSPTSFEEMVQQGAIDDTWGAYKNWRNMRAEHRVWVYYGVADGDLGVVGLARVIEVEPPTAPRGRATIHLRWDRQATLRLLNSPYPAAEVRKHISRPQGAAWAIPDELARSIRLQAGGTPKREPAQQTKYGNAKKSTIAYTPPKSVTVNRRHDALLRPVETRLASAGWELHRFDIGAKSADLVMQRNGELILIEAKTIGATTNKAVREAFAQLAEYTWRYRDSSSKVLPVTRWALFESEPAEDEIRFLEDHDIRVTWAARSARRLIHGPATAKLAHAVGL
jgi:hypothetical protein